MRAEVAESWQRSAAAGVEVGQGDAPVVLGTADLHARRRDHPLSAVLPLLDEVLGDAVRDSGAALALTDAEGTLMWVQGSHATLRLAERIGFVEGSCWDERAAGTNAPGLALRTGRLATVTRSEHFCDRVRTWSCVATPIRLPRTREVVGVLDVTGGDQVAVPQTLGMVRAAARLAEAELAHLTVRDTRPAAATGRSGVPVVLECLGRDEVVMRVDRGQGAPRELRLRPRHSELVVVLASAPLGVPGDELATLLYPEDGASATSTLRAELNRLRHLVGGDLVASRPYRLTADVAGDWHTVDALLAAGDVRAALRGYPGPLLPHSRAPGVVRLRENLEYAVRHAVLLSGDLELLATWTRSAWGEDDYEMWAAQRSLLGAASPLRPLVEGQLARLDHGLA